MKNKVIITLAVILLICAGVVGYFWLTNGRSTFNADNEVYTGELAPDFTVQLLSGEYFTLSYHRGTVVVLDFWATWCGPCVAKMPTIQALHEQFGDRVIFVGMNVGEAQSRVQEFIDDRGFTYAIGLDVGSRIHRNYYPSPGVPYMVIINGEGVITSTFLGGGVGLEAIYTQAILEALGE